MKQEVDVRQQTKSFIAYTPSIFKVYIPYLKSILPVRAKIFVTEMFWWLTDEVIQIYTIHLYERLYNYSYLNFFIATNHSQKMNLSLYNLRTKFSW